ncbi:helix-turn-helix domain-containing protein [bacterium]|nr:helix-turn-helix domain-containing protein [bacterium]
MSEKEKNEKKEALKTLRKTRSNRIEQVRQMNKDQTGDIRNISEQLQSGGKTVPEIAAAVSIPTSQVMLIVAGLMEYGLVVEGAKDGNYFKYELVPQ